MDIQDGAKRRCWEAGDGKKKSGDGKKKANENGVIVKSYN
tara:strand:+ start:318 stop:437 length:120 start_codon:yes stop_codon:yes gene_type:complete